MDISDYDFLSGKFTINEIKIIKKRIVESILLTDMATMKQLREDFQNHLNKFEIHDQKNVEKLIDFSSPTTLEKSKQLVSSVVLHACDISTSLRDFDISTQWADLLFDEFFNQGDMELAQGLEISMMCDRTTTNIAGGQAGFIQFVVMPIFAQLAEICPAIDDLQIESGKQNIEKWKIKAENEKIFKERQEKMKQGKSNGSSNRKIEEESEKQSQAI